MAANVVVSIDPGLKKQTVKTTPAMSLKAVLSTVCEKQRLGDPENWILKHGRNTLDLSLSIRFANLPTGAKLDLVRSTTNVSRPGAKPAEVTIALQLESGRVVGKFPNTTTLWEILLHFEELSKGTLNLTRRCGPSPKDGNSKNLFQNFFKKHGEQQEVYFQPVCVFTNQEYSTISVLKTTTLQSAGLSAGNAVLRVFFRVTPVTLEEILPEIQSVASVPNHLSPTTELTVAEPCSSTLQNTKPVAPAFDEKPDNQSMNTTTNADVQAPLNQPPLAATISNQNPHPQQAQPEPMNLDNPDNSAISLITHAGSSELNRSTFRNVRVFRPPPDMGNISNKIELPDSFFELTSTEIHSLMHSQKVRRTAEEQAGFKTSATRAAEEAARERRHPKTMIRVRFPDRMQLQGEFNSHEPVSTVYGFVEKSLSETGRQFFLYTTPPKQILKTMDITLYKAGLAPATVVFFSWENHEVGQSPYLIPALLESLEDLAIDVPMPDAEPEVIEENSVPTNFPDAGAGHLLTSTRSEEVEENAARRNTLEFSESNQTSKRNVEQSSKMPKWLKLGKK